MKRNNEIHQYYQKGFAEGYRTCERDSVKDAKDYKVLKEHSVNCGIVGTENIFYLLREGYWGNTKGKNVKKGNWYFWFPIICNDTGCEFNAIIGDKLLSKLIQKLDLINPITKAV